VKITKLYFKKSSILKGEIKNIYIKKQHQKNTWVNWPNLWKEVSPHVEGDASLYGRRSHGI